MCMCTHMVLLATSHHARHHLLLHHVGRARATRTMGCRMASLSTTDMNDDKDVAAHSVVIHCTSPILDGRNTQQQHGEYVGFAEDPTLSDPALPLLIDAREARTVWMRDARTRTPTSAGGVAAALRTAGPGSGRRPSAVG